MKAIIFDFDGVIHDDFELAYQINAKVLGKKFTREKYRDFFDGNIYKHPEVTKEGTAKYFKMQNEVFKHLVLEEKIKKFLKKLSKSYPLFIISSNSEATLNLYFANNKFINIFKEILGVETHKSKTKKFYYLFNKYKFKPAECIFVTDTLGDILEGHRVGVKTIAVDFGFHDRKRLAKGKPFKIVSSFDEIFEILKVV